ncbi:uncharacterized protein LOC125230021 [Leguminivora glycinivorella]|uniref:uncharacterized protein LOC125230021 n=1 Tax=Leguminivora glycinivorella TaxID=1035111 RepID=UPI0020104D12|nr:uncharacterized protein LOC125230021 [Leguminivora glycinivorella]
MLKALLAAICTWLLCASVLSAPPASPRRRSRGRTKLYTVFDPIFGTVTPSSDIKDFADYVFGRYAVLRDDNENDNDNDYDDTEATTNSGEDLRPSKSNIAANVGFEQYWPKGEWVYRKAELDFCNSTGSCGEMVKEYGVICAGNHDLSAHHTFENICEMDDANCRDGSYTVFTTKDELKNESLTWIPITTSGQITMKISSKKQLWFILTRNRNFFSRPKRAFVYGYACWNFETCVRIVSGDGVFLPHPYYWTIHDTRSLAQYWDYRLADPEYDYWKSKKFLLNQYVHQWRLSWNESTGFVGFT